MHNSYYLQHNPYSVPLPPLPAKPTVSAKPRTSFKLTLASWLLPWALVSGLLLFIPGMPWLIFILSVLTGIPTLILYPLVSAALILLTWIPSLFVKKDENPIEAAVNAGAKFVGTVIFFKVLRHFIE